MCRSLHLFFGKPKASCGKRDYVDCVLTVCWLYVDCMLTVCWLYVDCMCMVYSMYIPSTACIWYQLSWYCLVAGTCLDLRQPNQLPSCQQSGQLKLSFFSPLAAPRFNVVEMSDEEARVFSFLIFGRVGICSTTRDHMLDPSRTPSMGQINENWNRKRCPVLIPLSFHRYCWWTK